LTQVAKDLGFAITRSSKKKKITKNNPQYAGFPVASLEKYVDKLIKLGYVVAIFIQRDDPINKGKKIRVLDKIISKGTYIDNIKNDLSHNVVLVYIKHRTKINSILDISISSIDLSTGKSYC